MIGTTCALALLLTAASLAPALSQTTAPPAPYVVVPFAPPGNRDQILEQADAQFVSTMQGQGVSVVASPPMDLVDAALGVQALCDRYKASGVILGSFRHEQHAAQFFTYPAHAEVRLFRVSCGGKVLWRGMGIGDARLGDARKSEDTAARDAVSNALSQLEANIASL